MYVRRIEQVIKYLLVFKGLGEEGKESVVFVLKSSQNR